MPNPFNPSPHFYHRFNPLTEKRSIMKDTINYYKSLEVRYGLHHIQTHLLLPLFCSTGDVERVVNSMVLRQFPALGIDYTFCKPERNSTPHHFVVKYKVDGVGFIKDYQTQTKIIKEVTLKYSSEELKNLSPLDILVAAYWATNCTQMDGVKSSKLINDICVYLHDAITVKRGNEHD